MKATNPGLQALALFDNPAMFSDKQVHAKIRHLINALIDGEQQVERLSHGSLLLLEHLLAGAVEAVSAARQKETDNEELESVYRGLLLLTDDVNQAPLKIKT